MKNLSKLRQIVHQHRNQLEKKYYIKTIGLFGSYIKREQKKDSDIDILVEFEKPISLFKFLDLEEYLQKILSLKVDLVSRNTLKPHIGKHILKEVNYL
jgi:predicted nucleotidyltransferase